MNIINNIIIIFIFIVISLKFNITSLNTDNILKNKLLLFFSIFILQTVLLYIHKIKNNCKTFKNVFNDSFTFSLLTIIGYSIYIDLINIQYTSNILSNWFIDYDSNIFLASSIISLFLIFSMTIKLIIFEKDDKCENDL